MSTTPSSTGAEKQAARTLAVKEVVAALGIFPVLIVLAIVFAFLAPNFATEGNVMNIARQASVNIVLAAGMTFVILTGGIDLSVGAVLGCTAVVSVVVSLVPGLGWLAVPVALLTGLLMGAMNGVLVAYLKLPSFIVTLGAFTALRGVAYLLAGGTTVINSDLGFAWIGNEYLGPIPWLVIIAIGVIVLSWLLLRRTVLGVHIYAVGGNPTAARLAGLKVSLVLVFVYSLSGFLAGLGGVMTASRLYSANGNLGIGYELDAIAAVILGGTSFVGGIGSIIGTLFGALIIATLNNGLTLMNVSYFWQLVIKGLVIIAAVILDRYRSQSGART
jgi:ribose transport system permease protein